MGISSHRAFRPPKRRAHRTRTEFEPSDLQNVARAESAPNSNTQTFKTPNSSLQTSKTSRAPNSNRRTVRTSRTHRIRAEFEPSDVQNVARTERAPNSNLQTSNTSHAPNPHRIRTSNLQNAELEPSDLQNVAARRIRTVGPSTFRQRTEYEPNSSLQTSKTARAHRTRTEFEPSDLQNVARTEHAPNSNLQTSKTSHAPNPHRIRTPKPSKRRIPSES